MAKFCGIVGFFSENVEEDPENEPGVYVNKVVERTYYGDVMKNSRRYESGDKINDDLVISNSFSIVADDYAYDHVSSILYVEWMGVKWSVNYAEIQRPRIILNAGGVYNGSTA